jgi:hypothetical protein
MKLLKLIARGRKAVVPSSITDSPERAPSSRAVNHRMESAGSGYTNVIPNRQVTKNVGNYTPPPKRAPWTVIPDGVCRGC